MCVRGVAVRGVAVRGVAVRVMAVRVMAVRVMAVRGMRVMGVMAVVSHLALGRLRNCDVFRTWRGYSSGRQATARSVARRQKGEPNLFIRSYYACVRASLECYLSKRARVKPSTNIASSCCGEGCAEKRPA